MGMIFTTSGKQKRALRARMHSEKPVLRIGKSGLEESVILSAQQVLAARELIKIAVGKSCELPPKQAAEQLAEALSAEVIEVKGRTAILYRPEESES